MEEFQFKHEDVNINKQNTENNTQPNSLTELVKTNTQDKSLLINNEDNKYENYFDEEDFIFRKEELVLKESNDSQEDNSKKIIDNKQSDSQEFDERLRQIGRILNRTVVDDIRNVLDTLPDNNMKLAFNNFYDENIRSNERNVPRSVMHQLLWEDEFGGDIFGGNQQMKQEFREFYINYFLQGPFIIRHIGEYYYYKYFVPQLMDKAINLDSLNTNYHYDDYNDSGQSNFIDDTVIQKNLEQKQYDVNITEGSVQTMETMASLADQNLQLSLSPKKQKYSSQTYQQEPNKNIPVMNFLTQEFPKNKRNLELAQSNNLIDYEDFDIKSVQISQSSLDGNIDSEDLKNLIEFQIQEQTTQGNMDQNWADNQNQNNQLEEYREAGQEMYPQLDDSFTQENYQVLDFNNLDHQQDQPNQQFQQPQQGYDEDNNINMLSEVLSSQEQQFLMNLDLEDNHASADSQMMTMTQLDDYFI